MKRFYLYALLALATAMVCHAADIELYQNGQLIGAADIPEGGSVKIRVLAPKTDGYQEQEEEGEAEEDTNKTGDDSDDSSEDGSAEDDTTDDHNHAGESGEHQASRTIRYTQGTAGKRDYVVGSVVGREGHGNRIFCGVSHLSYDDPIIYPGQPGKAHLHMFWGNTSTDAYSTPQSLPYEGMSSCEGGSNYRAGLWIPAVHKASGEVVVPDETFIYYKKFGSKSLNYNHLQVVPQGLAMLASSATTNYRSAYIKVKLGFKDDGTILEKDGRRVIRFDIRFPSCVATEDGTRTGKPILAYQDMPAPLNKIVNSHVAYPGGPNANSVDCPATHPYGFPEPAGELFFDYSIAGPGIYVSADYMVPGNVDEAGSLIAKLQDVHGDYIYGMDETVSEQILQCTIEARNCRFDTSGGNLEERWYSPEGKQIYQGTKLHKDTDRLSLGKLPSMLRH